MDSNITVLPNQYGGFYEVGKAFTDSRWSSIVKTYTTICQNTGSCSVRTLAKEAKCSKDSAHKAIVLCKRGMSKMPRRKRGHNKVGIGTLVGLKIQHHAFLYSLYKSNPAMPLYGYCKEMERHFNMVVSEMFIQRWFYTVGPYKGTLRKTSAFPKAKHSVENILRLITYLEFITEVADHSRLVFADEKPMKECMIFPHVRGDPMNGERPTNTARANSKNRYNILCAVNIKGGVVPPVQSVVLDETTNAAIFLQFVKLLIETGVLGAGDYFIVDNCTVHYQGDNIGLEETLRDMFGITLVALPAYHPEFNPTELIFQLVFQRLRANRARYTALNNDDFLEEVKNEMANFDLLDIVKCYDSQGYLK